MRIRFWSEDGTRYVTIRPEEFKDYVKKRREGKVMPLPKQVKPPTSTSNPTILAMGEAEAKALLAAFLEDIESLLTSAGKDAMISIKLGYKNGYQLSLKTGKTSMWYNISAPTLVDCINLYLQGEFDNA
jgi:hypothetical protein